MATLLQPGEYENAWDRGERADDEEYWPAGPFGHEARRRRQVGTANGREGRQERVLRGGVERALAQRGEIGHEDHSADRAGEILHDDGRRQRPVVEADISLPGEHQI